MTLAALIRGERAGDSARSATATVATVATVRPPRASVASVAGVAVANPQNSATDALPDPAAAARRLRVLAILTERPGTRYAALTDTEADPEAVILALAIRDVATCELRIPRQKYDPFLLLELIERHGGTIH